MPTVTVKGMSCNHCKMSVTKAVAGVSGVKDVEWMSAWKREKPRGPNRPPWTWRP